MSRIPRLIFNLLCTEQGMVHLQLDVAAWPSILLKQGQTSILSRHESEASLPPFKFTHPTTGRIFRRLALAPHISSLVSPPRLPSFKSRHRVISTAGSKESSWKASLPPG